MIGIDPGPHGEVMSRLDGAVREIANILAELDTVAADLSQWWSGEAKHAYVQAHDTWSARMATMAEILTTCVEQGRGSGRRLIEADQAAAALW